MKQRIDFSQPLDKKKIMILDFFESTRRPVSFYAGFETLFQIAWSILIVFDPKGVLFDESVFVFFGT